MIKYTFLRAGRPQMSMCLKTPINQSILPSCALNDPRCRSALKHQSINQTSTNHCGKKENCPQQQFLPFPKCFQDLDCRHIKTKACLGKGCLTIKAFQHI